MAKQARSRGAAAECFGVLGLLNDAQNVPHGSF